ncbi:cyclopropane-fatty-acyl-phospholipid synthase [Pseudoalteromonas tunicata]|uniref:SAM-dependent methyltransferase n=1 Tax=Pseudoalteromonas tunicata TaxID=314281 RepID=UPI00273E6B91|nr:cyclopropane-fatty-acyl-phospholipid synthase family protein [Pseudoalteromonas tunicata]MDP5214161.1 cyclopropane-fatty-acyl-phospholipid synthase [Pseudoalteromonas tunicata]
MEQTQSLQLSQSISWFNTKCRNLVFSLLDQIDNACIEIHEGAHFKTFGNPNADLKAQLHILDLSCYIDFVKGGSIAAAEAFLDKKWTTPDLTHVIQVFARSQKQLDAIEQQASWLSKIKHKLLSIRNANTEQGSKKNILAHYDLGNELYTRFLDSSMMYSAAIYYSPEDTLAQAQQQKLALICDKLALKPTDHLIEIGTGWGALAIFAASHYGCKVTTTTISDAQYEWAAAEVKRLGLNDKITLLKQDYRLLSGQYDKLVSIEMIEAVGHEFMAGFFNKCNSLLKDDGTMLIQAITIADQRYHHYRKNVDFIQKYIFPGGCLPSIAVMSEHIAQQTNMMIDNIEDIGLHYARTLHDWRMQFDKNWQQISQFGYDEQFKRLWHYYLSYCEGAFIERVISTHHIVARKPSYKSSRDESILNY